MSDDQLRDGALPPEERPETDAADAVASGPEAPAPPVARATPAAPPPPPPPTRLAYGPPPAGYGPPPNIPPHWVAQVPSQPRRRNSWWVTLGILLAIVVIGSLMLAMVGHFMTGMDTAPSFGGGHVAVIPIEGVIRDGGAGGFFSGPPGARGIMKDIRAAGKDSSVSAILLLINSPGGSAAASDAIYEEIMRVRTKEKKKVVACMADVAASGGYYVAAACDKIVAHGATLTGSIGVIFGGIGYYGLFDKLGLTDQTLTAGKYKDIGSGSRPMTAEERGILLAILNDVYEQFITAVADGRKMERSKVRQIAQGRIYTGRQAKSAGLVDEIGNFYDAVKLAGELAGIKGEPKVKYYRESGGLFSDFMSGESSLHRFLRGRAQPGPLPLQGPMLLMPYGQGPGIMEWGTGTAGH